MATIDAITGGKFQDAGGNVVALGSITFQLSGPAQTINDGQAVDNVPVTFPLNSSGSVASGNLYGNDQLTPSGTYYTVTILNASGALVRGPENWVLQGTSPIDLGGIVASTPSISYSGFVLTNPSADQTIAADNLLPNTGNSTQSLGNVSAQWNGYFGAVTANTVAANITATNVNTTSLSVSGLTSAANIRMTGKFTLYEGISTAAAGLPYIVAQNLSPNLQTNFNAGTQKTLYTTAANGMHRLSATLAVINTPTGGEVPNVNLLYTDIGGVSRTISLWNSVVTSGVISLSNIQPMYCAASTAINIQVSNYAPGSGGALAYALGLTVEALT